MRSHKRQVRVQNHESKVNEQCCCFETQMLAKLVKLGFGIAGAKSHGWGNRIQMHSVGEAQNNWARNNKNSDSNSHNNSNTHIKTQWQHARCREISGPPLRWSWSCSCSGRTPLEAILQPSMRRRLAKTASARWVNIRIIVHSNGKINWWFKPFKNMFFKNIKKLISSSFSYPLTISTYILENGF